MIFCFGTTLQNTRAGQVFEERFERDIPLKKSLPIYLNHRLGNVMIQGWAQDRIRVTLSKRMLADTEAQAIQEFRKLDFLTLETAKSFELRVGHAHGADLVTKMKDEIQSLVQVDLEIKAPYQSNLTVVLGEGKNLKLQEWRGGVNIVGKGNSLQFFKLYLTEKISVNCLKCATEVRDSRMEGHLLVGSKAVLLNEVDGKKGLSIDAGNEEIKIENSRGNMNVSSLAGRLNVNQFQGTLHFHSVEGGANLQKFSGEVSVQTETGQVVLDVDQNLSVMNIDTGKSDIQITLPQAFSGGLDLMSLHGEIIVQFPYTQIQVANDAYGPASLGRVEGYIGKSHAQRLHAYSKQGGIRILRKSGAR